MKTINVLMASIIVALIIIGIVSSLPQEGIDNGAIIDQNYICGNLDGVCPPVFTNVTCDYDPDCIYIINGSTYITNESNNNTYRSVKVILTLMNSSQTYETVSNDSGYYELRITAPPFIDKYVISAIGSGYESSGKRFPLIYPPANIVMDLPLIKSDCNAECTHNDNICSYNCINFSDVNGSCSPINETILKLCNGKRVNEYVVWKRDSSYLYLAQCCEGNNIKKVPLVHVDIKGSPKQVAKTEVTSRLANLPVKIVILTWD